MRSRLPKFLFFFVLILIVVEVVARVNGPTLAALSDKMLLKIELLRRSPETSILFLGTSRFVDAIDQKRFDRELSVRTGLNLKCLNGASTGSQANRTAYFAAIAASNPNLSHVILEASPPSLTDGVLGLPEFLDDAVPGDDAALDSVNGSERFADRFERGLQDLASRNIALVKYRKAFRAFSLLKVPVILMADRFDPNFWMRADKIREILNAHRSAATPEMVDLLVPSVFSKESEPDSPGQAASGDYYENLLRLSQIFEGSGITVIWVAPPVSEAETANNSGGVLSANYVALARRFNLFVYDYAALKTDGKLLRDPTHLNATGRSNFSSALARDLAKHFQGRH